jgi:hypothetical protein
MTLARFAAGAPACAGSGSCTGASGDRSDSDVAEEEVEEPSWEVVRVEPAVAPAREPKTGRANILDFVVR